MGTTFGTNVGSGDGTIVGTTVGSVVGTTVVGWDVVPVTTGAALLVGVAEGAEVADAYEKLYARHCA